MRIQRSASHAGWVVEYHDEFRADLGTESEAVQVAVIAASGFLQQFGPQLGRPHVDTLKGSSHSNMKELRITLVEGEWRIAFAFDPRRRAILLCGGSKSGVGQRSFYERLIRVADRRYAEHLHKLTTKGE